jgi:hypothetical protein
LQGWAVAIAFVGLALLHAWPVLWSNGRWGIQDWDVHTFLQAAPRVSLLQYHQVPLWNPWFCGGMPLLARPESAFVTPLYGVILLGGELVGLRIWILLHLVVGLFGVHVVARDLRQSRLAGMLAGVLFMMSSAYAVHVSAGNIWALNMAWMPWALWAWGRALRVAHGPKVRGAWRSPPLLACAVFLSLMWLGGGPYPFVMTILFLGIQSGAMAVWRVARVGTAVWMLVFLMVWTVLLSAVKLFPAIEFTLQYPRLHTIPTGFSVAALVHGLLGRDQSLELPAGLQMGDGLMSGASQFMNEIGMYVGWVPLLLMLAGTVAGGRGRRPLLVGMVLLLWLSLGVRAPVSLWNGLHELPVLNIMRVAERFRLVYLLILALLAGWGLDVVRVALARRRWEHTLPALVLILLIACDLMLVVRPVWARTFIIPPLDMGGSRASPFTQTAEHYWVGPEGWATAADNPVYCAWSSHYPAFLSNQGIVHGNEEIPVPQAAIAIETPRYRGEVWIEGGDGHAAYAGWTPNRLEVDVRVAQPAALVVNQNFYTGWCVSDGRAVFSTNGLLATKVSPADGRLTFVYRPWTVIAGALVSGVGAFVAVAVGIHGWRRRREVS